MEVRITHFKKSATPVFIVGRLDRSIMRISRLLFPVRALRSSIAA